MALTQEIDQKLDRASLIAYFKTNQLAWRANVQDAYNYTKKAFAGVTIRPDDVAKTLRPVVEIDIPLRKALDQKRLSQKYWVDYFTFLVIDRAWDTLKKWESGMSKEEALREAEAFVRKALSRTTKTRVAKATIKAAAVKVARVVPKQRSHQKATAA